jgi:hypothetical protein
MGVIATIFLDQHLFCRDALRGASLIFQIAQLASRLSSTPDYVAAAIWFNGPFFDFTPHQSLSVRQHK